MRALLILGAVVAVAVLPVLGYAIRALMRRPLSPEQVERDRLLEERRRDARYFWR